MSVQPNDEFTRLTVLRRKEGTRRSWVCVCDCGTETVEYESDLLSGHNKSCGCLHEEVLTASGYNSRTHGESTGGKLTSEYAIWRSMRARCQRKSDSNYFRYGARGIKVCDRWLKFSNFLVDMGRRPSTEHSIERRDNDGNYEPSNCYWGTRLQQARNKRNNLVVTIGGESLCITEWAERSDISAATLRRRYHARWPPEKFLLPPKVGQKIMISS